MHLQCTRQILYSVYIYIYIKWTICKLNIGSSAHRMLEICCIDTSSSVTALLLLHPSEGGGWNAAWHVTWPHNLCPACNLLLLSLIWRPAGETPRVRQLASAPAALLQQVVPFLLRNTTLESLVPELSDWNRESSMTAEVASKDGWDKLEKKTLRRGGRNNSLLLSSFFFLKTPPNALRHRTGFDSSKKPKRTHVKHH